MADLTEVQHGTLTVNTAYTNTPFQTATITPVDTARSIALWSGQFENPASPNADDDQDSGLWRIALQNTSTVEMERAGNPNNRPGSIQWQVIQFQN